MAGKVTGKKAAKTKGNRGGDRHASGFMVRLPECYRDRLAKLRDRDHVIITTSVQLALDDYLKAKGV